MIMHADLHLDRLDGFVVGLYAHPSLRAVAMVGSPTVPAQIKSFAIACSASSELSVDRDVCWLRRSNQSCPRARLQECPL